MDNVLSNSKTVSRNVFIGSVVALLIISATVGSLEYYQVNDLQSSNNKLQTDYQNLQTSNNQLQTTYNQLQTTYNQLQTAYNQLQSSQSSSSSQTIANLQSQITSLQSQLSNATTLIAQLQGPTGILPTYMDLGYVGNINEGYYLLQLSLKNTGTVPITQIYVTINSVQMAMTFTYLNTTVNEASSLPSYQTATGGQNVTPTINGIGTYPLVIQALATNGTIYTYQTTITSHTY